MAFPLDLYPPPSPQFDPYALGEPLEPPAPLHSTSPSLEPPSSGSSPQLDAPGLPFLLEQDDSSSLSAASAEELVLASDAGGTELAPTTYPTTTELPASFYPGAMADSFSQEDLPGVPADWLLPSSEFFLGQNQAFMSDHVASSSSYTPNAHRGHPLDNTYAWVQNVELAQLTASPEMDRHIAGPSRPAKTKSRRQQAAPYSSAARPSSSKQKRKNQFSAFADEADADWEDESSATPSEDWQEDHSHSAGRKGKGKAQPQKRKEPRVKPQVSFATVGGLYLGDAYNLRDYMEGQNPAGPRPHFPRLKDGHRLYQMMHCVLCGCKDKNPRRHLLYDPEHACSWQRALLPLGDVSAVTAEKRSLVIITMLMLFNSEHMEFSRNDWDFKILPWTQEAEAAKAKFIKDYADVDYDKIEDFSLTGEFAPLLPHFQHWARTCIARRTCDCGVEYSRPDAADRCKACLARRAAEQV